MIHQVNDSPGQYTFFSDIISHRSKTKIPSPQISSLWRLEPGLHFCTTGNRGLVDPRLHTPAAEFPQHVAAVTEVGSPTSVDPLRIDNSALVGNRT